MSSEEQRREPLESTPTAHLAPLLEPARAKGARSKDRLQAQLRQSQKLEAVGMFAAGIAHDFNNILGAILGYGELVQRATPAGSVERRYVDKLMQAGGRAKSLVECILAFSRTGVADRAPINVQAVIEEALELLAASVAPGVRLETRLEDGNAAILGDATQLLRLTTNLCTNALQAMENGGVLGVTLDCMHLEQSRVLSHGSLTPGAYARLRVCDTGSGIPPDVLERMFDPYFTTKRTTGGTGLGLALVHGIVADLGGSIDVCTTVGRGTAMTIWLPIAGEARVTPVQTATGLAPPASGGEVVMIAGDLDFR